MPLPRNFILACVILLLACTSHAQSEVELPQWMITAIGMERMKPATFQGNDVHAHWFNEQRRPHRFIGAYTMEAFRQGKDSVQVRFIIEGWQDSTKAIIIMLGLEEEASFTYLADLDADVAIIAEREGERAELRVFRISSLVTSGRSGYGVYYREQVPDSATGRTTTLLGRSCEERVMKEEPGGTFWIDTTRNSPFESMGRWVPVHYFPFQLFTKLSAQGHGLPMKYEEGENGLRMTKVTAKRTPMPAVDLRTFGILERDGKLVVHGGIAEREHLVATAPGPVAMEEPAPPLKEEPVFDVVEERPEFPGGEGELMLYVAKATRYPDAERQARIQGKVYVEFVIDRDGSIHDVRVKRGVQGGPGLDREAVRVIKAMPKWTPGRMNGRPVPVRYIIPVAFALD